MEYWKRKYLLTSNDVYQKTKERLQKVEKPEYISNYIWNAVVKETAEKLTYQFMTKLRQGEKRYE
tara:strand:- start:306 stop:500 length:195 start_codon:yes stop_codon:yes gene_type:complete